MEHLSRNTIRTLALIASLLFLGFPELQAQCAMCKAQAQTALQGDSTDPLGLNMAIMFMFFTPYFIIGTIAFFLYRRRKMSQSA